MEKAEGGHGVRSWVSLGLWKNNVLGCWNKRWEEDKRRWAGDWSREVDGNPLVTVGDGRNGRTELDEKPMATAKTNQIIEDTRHWWEEFYRNEDESTKTVKETA
ncbi:hypothetical protein HDV00_011779 [Rhizophlyctis rosea]|nr:hypothetical protein HDV00_011779 [Rhizophlyctis rosea]